MNRRSCSACRSASSPATTRRRPDRTGQTGAGTHPAWIGGTQDTESAMTDASSTSPVPAGYAPERADGRLVTLPARPEPLRLKPAETALVIVDMPNAYASRSEEHTSELQSLMRISDAVFC